MSRLLMMILSRWVRIMRFWSMMTGMITWFGMVIPGFRVGRFGGSGITFTALAIHSSGMVTGSQIFVENRSIATVEGVLFAIGMAVMVNLTSGLRIGIMTVRIGYFTTIKGCVSIMRGNSDRFDLFRLVRSFFEHHGSLGFVGMGDSIAVSRWGSIGRFRLVVTRCGGMIWFRLVI